jgi:hypothetical protein
LEANPVELIVKLPKKRKEKKEKKALDLTPVPGTNFRWSSEDSNLSCGRYL